MTANGDKSLARATAGAAGVWLPALLGGLLRAQSRWRLGAMLCGAVWSLLLGLAVFCALEGSARLLDAAVAARWLPVLFANPLVDHLAKSVLTFAGALAGAALASTLQAPDLAALSRAADRKFALKERLSTALEVAATLPSNAAPDPVRAALLADAERRADTLDWRALVSLRLPRVAWAVPALLVAALLLQAIPPDAFGRAQLGASTARDSSVDGTLSSRQAADTAGNLRRIAEILDQDAAQRSDPYLRTIARTLERLSTEVARATIDRPRLASELSQLLLHAQQAYAQSDRTIDQPATRRSPTELLRSALDEITGNRQASATPARDTDSSAPEAAERSQPDRPSQPQERRASGARTPAEQMAAAARRQLGADIPWIFVDEDGNEVDPRSQIERLVAEEERRARAAAQPAGAATNAGVGEGDQAGDGVQPLGRGGAKTTDLAATEQMLLPDPQGRDGGRIRIEIPPNAAHSNVAAPTADASGGWRRVPEQSVEREALEAEGRRIVGRYFKRSSEGHRDPGAQGRGP
jgi:hypothetical protein